MLIPFIKMHAQGNDFVILDNMENTLPQLNFDALSKDICTPHTGIYADGLVILSASTKADARMIIFNSDGSRAEMCGSALRCVAFMLQQKLRQEKLMIETDSGIKQAKVIIQVEENNITVNMGFPKLYQGSVSALGFNGDLIDTGNLHFCIWTDSLSENPHLKHGSALEKYIRFPKAVNVHFIKIVSPSEIQIAIWERSCGATLACGTGATACVYSGIMRGNLESRVKVIMPGGTVVCENHPSGYLLTGSVHQSFVGEYRWKA
ncbi:MAG: diaminopimelate epimerase [Candidatus Cloacimonetes bacterium]|nr:diaminopimelate epimerase [Candidatus Cloacimonadota bacterium]